MHISLLYLCKSITRRILLVFFSDPSPPFSNNSRGMTSTFQSGASMGKKKVFLLQLKCFKRSDFAFLFKGINLFTLLLLKTVKKKSHCTFMMKNINIYTCTDTNKAWSLNISAAAQWNSGLVDIHHLNPPSNRKRDKRETSRLRELVASS